MEQTRKCPRCGAELELTSENWPADAHADGGFKNICVTCMDRAIRQRAAAARNPMTGRNSPAQQYAQRRNYKREPRGKGWRE